MRRKSARARSPRSSAISCSDSISSIQAVTIRCLNGQITFGNDQLRTCPQRLDSSTEIDGTLVRQLDHRGGVHRAEAFQTRLGCSTAAAPARQVGIEQVPPRGVAAVEPRPAGRPLSRTDRRTAPRRSTAPAAPVLVTLDSGCGARGLQENDALEHRGRRQEGSSRRWQPVRRPRAFRANRPGRRPSPEREPELVHERGRRRARLLHRRELLAGDVLDQGEQEGVASVVRLTHERRQLSAAPGLARGAPAALARDQLVAALRLAVAGRRPAARGPARIDPPTRSTSPRGQVASPAAWTGWIISTGRWANKVACTSSSTSKRGRGLGAGVRRAEQAPSPPSVGLRARPSDGIGRSGEQPATSSFGDADERGTRVRKAGSPRCRSRNRLATSADNRVRPSTIASTPARRRPEETAQVSSDMTAFTDESSCEKPAERVILDACRHEHPVGRRQRVHRQRPQRRRAIDEDEGDSSRSHPSAPRRGSAPHARAGRGQRSAGEIGLRRRRSSLGKRVARVSSVASGAPSKIGAGSFARSPTEVAFACGSRSTMSTRSPALGEAGSEVDGGRRLADPPFWFASA